MTKSTIKIQIKCFSYYDVLFPLQKLDQERFKKVTTTKQWRHRISKHLFNLLGSAEPKSYFHSAPAWSTQIKLQPCSNSIRFKLTVRGEIVNHKKINNCNIYFTPEATDRWSFVVYSLDAIFSALHSIISGKAGRNGSQRNIMQSINSKLAQSHVKPAPNSLCEECCLSFTQLLIQGN